MDISDDEQRRAGSTDQARDVTVISARTLSLKSSGEVLAEHLEWMNSAAARSRGLLKYERAPERFAAIFRLPFFGFFPIMHTFGMKFSIDILFCDRNKKIISKFLSVGPSRLVCPWKYLFGGTRYVIEFSGANIARANLGDELTWSEP